MSDLKAYRQQVRSYYHRDETPVVESLLKAWEPYKDHHPKVQQEASALILAAREKIKDAPMMTRLIYKYKLSSQEGLALMILAEALLRIPDKETKRQLIQDQLAKVDWSHTAAEGDSWFLNMSDTALNLTSKFLKDSAQESLLGKAFKSLVKKTSEPIILQAVSQGLGFLSHKFVIGETIEQALKKAQEQEAHGYSHSYDMLGEMALTAEDAQRYFTHYQEAIQHIGDAIAKKSFPQNPTISVKLSALHPRYVFSQHQRVLKELTEKLEFLVRLAQKNHVGVTIDAEESHRLEVSMDILERLMTLPDIAQGGGLGFVVQAYQKRALPLLDWLNALAKISGAPLNVRLVKGAYWDSEIKLAQEQGVEDYPVFTQKYATDLNYAVCAQKLFDASHLYPFFATHNAYTLALVMNLAKGRPFEFQKLYGMGDEIYEALREKTKGQMHCRVYAPVGIHSQLLPYLVRRLLENGANSSFVNHLGSSSLKMDVLTPDPYQKILSLPQKRHGKIPLPQDIYGEKRLNAKGINLTDPLQVQEILPQVSQDLAPVARALKGKGRGGSLTVFNPFTQNPLGTLPQASHQDIQDFFLKAKEAWPEWTQLGVEARAAILMAMADTLEAHYGPLLALCAQEAGKTIADGIAEVREAVDFCRYYAQEALEKFSVPLTLKSVTGEENALRLHGRGIFVCISPWNFPLAIFVGQIAAALVTGNAVIAKPASQTSLIAQYVVDLFHAVGVPPKILQLCIGSGQTVGTPLISHGAVAGVAFTGSIETAWHINKTLAEKRGPLVPLIAETGGQNTMIVDSSALPEQVVADVLASAFQSAGQRCSALRVLFLQEDIAPQILSLLCGAMAELKLGDPLDLSTDVGPVIDGAARAQLQAYKDTLKAQGRLLYQCPLPAPCEQGYFVTPAVFKIESLSQVQKEHFGPILHVIVYSKNHLHTVVQQIHSTGFGLTQGIHTRLPSRIQELGETLRVGNIYVNRNMIGAVVGSQPFGGEGLSGTGPKAGGPHYLYAFSTERALSINTTAQGGNTSLLALDES